MNEDRFERIDRLVEKVSTDSFTVTSIHVADGRLLGADVLVRFPEKPYPYSLEIETWEHNLSKTMEADDTDVADYEEEGAAQAYVVAADEILPSDLVGICKMSFEELAPYLTEQSEDSDPTG